MKVELLYFEGCPTYRAAEDALREALAAGGSEAEVELISVDTEEKVERLRFPGSPTIRVDGRDLFPVPDRESWGLGCRVYATPGGMRGSPTAEMLAEALSSGRFASAG